jgi:3-oxoacyl-[acyl-carrier-protein] synthase-3
MEKVFVNLDRYGNMSSASIPVALDEAIEQGRVRKGSNVLTATFGAGLTWGAMTWRF